MKLVGTTFCIGLVASTAIAGPTTAQRRSPFEKAMSVVMASVTPHLPDILREDLVRDYFESKANKAQAVEPIGGSYFRFTHNDDPATTGDRALESCELRYAKPCGLIAVNDEIVVEGQVATQDMPRLHYSGEFALSKIPIIRDETRARADVQAYFGTVGSKAMAIHPWGKLFISTGKPNNREAQEAALSACNSDPRRNFKDGNCYVYAVGNQVVISERRQIATAVDSRIDESTKSPSPTPNLTAAATSEDESFWQAAKTSDVPGLFEEFLKRYPLSSRVPEARERLAALASKQSSSAGRPPVVGNERSAAVAVPSAPTIRVAKNVYSSDDAQRVGRLASQLGLTLPTFSFKELKDDVPPALERFVGVWAGQVGKGEGRQKMLIITDAQPDGFVSGNYVYGASAKGSWDLDPPAGSVSFSAKFSGNVLRFNSEDYSYELSLSTPNAMTMRLSKINNKSKTAIVRFAPVWRSSPDSAKKS